MPRDFETVLSIPPHLVPKAWYLKMYALWIETEVPGPHTIQPFGFAVCIDSEKTQLRLFYGRLFREHKLSPVRLQHAADDDQIFDLVINIPGLNISKIEKKFLRRGLKTQNRLSQSSSPV